MKKLLSMICLGLTMLYGEEIIVAVGSTNKAKVQAVIESLKDFKDFKEAKVFSINSTSNVSNQPMTFEETLQGATSRARNAYNQVLNCSHSFGIESGLMLAPGTRTGYLELTLCVIFDGSNYYTGMSTGFELPHQVLDLILAKGLDLTEACIELGIAKDLAFGVEEGLVGVITKGRVNRKEYSKECIYSAMVQLDNEEIYNSTITTQ